MFSKTCEYGLRAIIYIAQQTVQKNKVSLTTISEAIDSPHAFTAKILQQLSKNNVVTSIKGPYGGFIIEEEKIKSITLSEVVKILDGDSIYTGCGLGLSQCNDTSPCPLHFKFVAIREQLREMLENTSLEVLVNDMNTQNLYLKR